MRMSRRLWRCSRCMSGKGRRVRNSLLSGRGCTSMLPLSRHCRPISVCSSTIRGRERTTNPWSRRCGLPGCMISSGPLRQPQLCRSAQCVVERQRSAHHARCGGGAYGAVLRDRFTAGLYRFARHETGRRLPGNRWDRGVAIQLVTRGRSRLLCRGGG